MVKLKCDSDGSRSGAAVGFSTALSATFIIFPTCHGMPQIEITLLQIETALPQIETALS